MNKFVKAIFDSDELESFFNALHIQYSSKIELKFDWLMPYLRLNFTTSVKSMFSEFDVAVQ